MCEDKDFIVGQTKFKIDVLQVNTTCDLDRLCVQVQETSNWMPVPFNSR